MKDQFTPRMNLLEYHNIFDNEVMLSYKGPFDKTILSVIGNYIESLVKENKQVSRKMFSVFIELAQNIALYSTETSRFKEIQAGIGSIAMGEAENNYLLVTGNMVKTIDINPVIDKCKLINTLDRQALRKYKIEQRELAANKERSNIGLIQVALTSAKPLDVEVISVNNEMSFFTVSVSIDK